MTRIIIRCGLRSGDCRQLAFDCLVHDGEGHPYLQYLNHKMKRTAFMPLDDDHPLADTAWARRGIDRAKQTLPNGYCGMPLNSPCEHANPCLTCPMFITNADFLPQHETQLNHTLELIDISREKAGHPDLARAVLDCGATAYLAPQGAPFGYASLFAPVMLFYELTEERTLTEAVRRLAAHDHELSMWHLFT